MASLQDVYGALINIASSINQLSGMLLPGTMASQNANAVAITGGSLAGVTVSETTAGALTATGTTRADALAITAQINRVTTAAAGTGVVIDPAVGEVIALYNDGANPVQVYAAGSTTIDGTAGATGVPLTNGKRCLYTCIASGVVVSAQLGVVSA